MADIATASAGGERFDLGRVVGQTFGLTGRNFFLFFLLSLVFVGAPQFGLLYWQTVAMQTDPSLLAAIGGIGVIVNMVTTYILQGALTRASVDDLSGAGVKFGAALADGLRYFFPLFVVALLVSIGVFAGALLLLIPGIILAVRWSITAPIVVVERDGPTRSMGRSAELTEDHRWAIFGLMVIYVLIAWGASVVVAIAFQSLIGGGQDFAQTFTADVLGLSYMGVTSVLEALLTLISTVGAAALYFELRRVKEGVGVEQLAAVFD